MMQDDTLFTLLDFETSGLDKDRDVILEAAAVPIDIHTLEPIETSLRQVPFEMVVGHEELPPLEAYVHNMHTQNGLLRDVQEVASGQRGGCLSHDTLDIVLSDFFKGVGPGKKVFLIGNSIQFDRGFIEKKLPRTNSLLHHRQGCVSQLRVFYEAWCGEPPTQGKAHRALADCYMSLETARWARKLFKAGSSAMYFANMLSKALGD